MRWIVGRAEIKNNETFFPHANFLLALEQSCPLYDEKMCKKDMKELMKRTWAFEGRVTKELLQEMMVKYQGNEALMIVILGYIGKFREICSANITVDLFILFCCLSLFISFLGHYSLK